MRLNRDCLIGVGGWVVGRRSWVVSRGSWVVGRGSEIPRRYLHVMYAYFYANSNALSRSRCFVRELILTCTLSEKMLR